MVRGFIPRVAAAELGVRQGGADHGVVLRHGAVGDMACAESPMQSNPSRHQLRRRLIWTVSNLIFSQSSSSAMRSSQPPQSTTRFWLAAGSGRAGSGTNGRGATGTGSTGAGAVAGRVVVVEHRADEARVDSLTAYGNGQPGATGRGAVFRD